MTGSTERTSQLLGQTEVIFKNTLLQWKTRWNNFQKHTIPSTMRMYRINPIFLHGPGFTWNPYLDSFPLQ